MKLLVDCHCFDAKTTEGINTYIQGIYSILPRMAPHIDFFFSANNIAKIKAIFGEGDNIHYIALNGKNKFYRLLFEYPRIIKKYNIDWAHFQYTSPLIKNSKTIVTLHDILFKDFPQYFPFKYRLVKGLTFRISAKRADLLCTVSDYSRQRIAYHYGIPKQKIIVTPNAVSEDFSNTNKSEAKRFVAKKGINQYILYVSRREPRKNQITLLKSWIRINQRCKSPVDLVFIGRSTIPCVEFDECYNSLAPEVKCRIHIYNNVSFDELKLWYSAATAFVYPALAEGFGIPPIEAASSGIPVVCNNATAMGDFTFFGENLIDFSNKKLVDECILKIINEPFDPSIIRQAISAMYNWENSARILLTSLKSFR